MLKPKENHLNLLKLIMLKVMQKSSLKDIKIQHKKRTKIQSTIL